MQVGVFSECFLSTINGVAPVVISLAPGQSLPPGFGLSSSGRLAGIPTAPYNGTVNFQARDASGATVYGSRDFRIAAEALVWVSTAILPPATTGVRYEVKLEARGGVPPIVFTKYGNHPDLDEGLTLSPDGYIRGIPRRSGRNLFSVVLSDQRFLTTNPSLTREFSLSITETEIFRLLTNPLPTALLGQAYAANLAAAGGSQPYTFSLSAGSLPEGITLGPDGALRGLPTKSGQFPFSYRVRDSRDAVLLGNATLNVQGTRLSLVSAALPTAQRDVPYEHTLQGSGGTGPYRFSVAGSGLPAGVSLSQAGLLSGTPTVAGEFPFRVQISDGQNGFGEADLRLIVAVSLGPLSVRDSTLAPGQYRDRYTSRVEASGGQAPYQFALRSGSLPPGLSLGRDGSLSGWMLGKGPYEFTVEARDARGDAATRSMRIESSAHWLAAGLALERYQARFGTAGFRYELLNAPDNALPLGVTLNPDGSVEGFLWQQGEHVFRVRKQGQSGATEIETVVLTALPQGNANRVLDLSLPPALLGQGYTYPLRTLRGAARWRVERGTLPPGLQLDADGQLRGTPLEAGVWSFSVEAEPIGQARLSLAVLSEAGPRVVSAVNAASYRSVEVAPGELLALFGERIGGASLSVAALINGALPTDLAGTRFWVNGVAAPVLYTSNGQSSLVTPWLAEGEKIFRLEVERDGKRSIPWLLPVSPRQAGIFTASGTGEGVAAALNADGSVHSEQDRIEDGGVVVLFGTGFGRLERVGSSGATAIEAVRVSGEVRCSVAGKAAEVLYAGTSPGLLEAVNQINIRLPKGLGAGPHSLELNLGGATSNVVRIWVKE
jgi:uncharacterized protein (TIGR03437 family)